MLQGFPGSGVSLENLVANPLFDSESCESAGRILDLGSCLPYYLSSIQCSQLPVFVSVLFILIVFILFAFSLKIIFSKTKLIGQESTEVQYRESLDLCPRFDIPDLLALLHCDWYTCRQCVVLQVFPFLKLERFIYYTFHTSSYCFRSLVDFYF